MGDNETTRVNKLFHQSLGDRKPSEMLLETANQAIWNERDEKPSSRHRDDRSAERSFHRDERSANRSYHRDEEASKDNETTRINKLFHQYLGDRKPSEMLLEMAKHAPPFDKAREFFMKHLFLSQLPEPIRVAMADVPFDEDRMEEFAKLADTAWRVCTYTSSPCKTLDSRDFVKSEDKPETFKKKKTRGKKKKRNPANPANPANPSPCFPTGFGESDTVRSPHESRYNEYKMGDVKQLLHPQGMYDPVHPALLRIAKKQASKQN